MEIGILLMLKRNKNAFINRRLIIEQQILALGKHGWKRRWESTEAIASNFFPNLQGRLPYAPTWPRSQASCSIDHLFPKQKADRKVRVVREKA